MSNVDEKESKSSIHPMKFGLYLSFASIVMMFAGLTSAYIVRQAAGYWLEFRMPTWFFVSAGVILLSSVTLHASYLAFKNGKPLSYRILLVVSFLLGLGFMCTQYMGWNALQNSGIDLKDNPSGAFVYAISWLHAGHVLGGIAAIGIALVHAFGLDYKVTEQRKLRFEMTLQYWHFVDILWIYLLLFFLLQH